MKKANPLKLVHSKMPVKFGTKAETLQRLRTALSSAEVLPLFILTTDEWAKDREAVLGRLFAEPWTKKSVIVRSSAKTEDSAKASLAGHFESVLHVKSRSEISEAIDRVERSYENQNEQILIQPCIEKPVLSGVAFSADPSTGSPYVIINYDDTSGSTSSVTAGSSNSLRTYYHYASSKVSAPEALRPVLEMIQELKTVLQHDALDAEFAIDKKGKLYLFQVRPLVMPILNTVPAPQIEAALKKAEEKFANLSTPHPYLLGEKTVLGVMPDWNPAEIIGIRPRPLALSLYKELVTDSIWAYQRDNYGYRNLRSFPLMVSLGGLPYIDVRVSFNSFVPRDIDAKLGEKLLNYYTAKLIESPANHDKVEFAILNTCYTFDIEDRLQAMKDAGFTNEECKTLSRSLLELTNTIIHGSEGLWRQDLEKVQRLSEKLATIKESDLDIVSRLYWIIEDCKRFGTLPFAGLARAGFIAVQMLKSLVHVGVLEQTDYDSFMGSLETVSSRMKTDLASLPREAFLEKYGHLRPGTYDILSPRYDENPDHYFDWAGKQALVTPSPTSFSLSMSQLRQVEKLLAEHGLRYDVVDFFEWIKKAIEAREDAKFVFTRSLSDALSLFQQFCHAQKISAEDCSFADINCIRTLYSSSADAGQVLRASVEQGRAAYQVTQALTLPPLIVEAKDFWSFELPSGEPNFITQKAVTLPTSGLTVSPNQFKGKILFVPSADPGYDWIFSHGIGGLITMYGGANSHMAIRAGELGIPAVIGAGEKLYRLWSEAAELLLDCANRQVKVIA